MPPKKLNNAVIDQSLILLIEQHLQQAIQLREMEQEITQNIDRLLDIHSELVANIELLRETARQIRSQNATYQYQASQATFTMFSQSDSPDSNWLEMHATPFGRDFENR